MFNPYQLMQQTQQTNQQTQQFPANNLPSINTVLANLQAQYLRQTLLNLATLQAQRILKQQQPSSQPVKDLQQQWQSPIQRTAFSTYGKCSSSSLLGSAEPHSTALASPSQQTHSECHADGTHDSLFSEGEDQDMDDEMMKPQQEGEYSTTVGAINDSEAFLDLPSNVNVLVQTGHSFDLRSVHIKKHVPDTKKFRIYTFKNPKSKRFIKILKCDFEECGKTFRKWHNFFDHLRIHTNERPYQCPHEDCQFSFTQRANLNKHIEVHGGVKRFSCPHCTRMFYTNFNLKSHLRTHNKDANRTKKTICK